MGLNYATNKPYPLELIHIGLQRVPTPSQVHLPQVITVLIPNLNHKDNDNPINLGLVSKISLPIYIWA